MRVWNQRFTIQIDQLPKADSPPHREGKFKIMIARLAGDGRQRLDEGKEVAQIVRRHPLHGCIGECGVFVRALWRNPLAHRADELSRRPATRFPSVRSDEIFGM